MFFRFQHFGPFAPLTTCWNGPRPGETLLERSQRPTPSTARPARTNARGEVTLTPGAPRRRPAAWDPGDTRITALKAQVRFFMSNHSGYLLRKVQERFKLWHFSGQQTFVMKRYEHFWRCFSKAEILHLTFAFKNDCHPSIYSLLQFCLIQSAYLYRFYF
jgi:hypothetical protein